MSEFGFDLVSATILPFYDVPALTFIAQTLGLKPKKTHQALVDQIETVPPKKLQEIATFIGGKPVQDNNQAYMTIYGKFMEDTYVDKLEELTTFSDKEFIKLEGFYFKMAGMPSSSRLETYKKHWHDAIERSSTEYFPLYPPKLQNRFHTLRNKVYNTIIPKYAICVQKISSSAIYILPKDNILPLMVELDAVEKQFQQLGDEVKEAFERLSQDPKMKKFVKEQELVFRQPNYFDMEVRYEFQPVQISASNLKTALRDALSSEVSKTTEKHLAELGYTQQQMAMKYERRMEESMTSHLAVVEKAFLDDLTDITRAVAETLLRMKSDGKGVINASHVKALERLEQKAKGIGFTNIAKASELTKKAIKSVRSGKKVDVQTFSIALAKHMDIPLSKAVVESEDVKDILITATSKMAGVIHPRTLALKRRIGRND